MMMAAFVACLMVAVDANAKKKMSSYLFVFFSNNSPEGEQIRFALSDDGYNYVSLNDGQPVVGSDSIALTKSIRDPHIIRGEDGKTFYMVLTDMRSSLGWQSNDGLILMKSTDLIHWQHTAIDFPNRFPNLEGFDRKNLHAVWAPQTIWDPVEKKYFIYYMVCGIGAGLMQELVQYIHYLSLAPELSMVSHDQLAEALNMWNTVGASGAVYGILLAFGMTFPEERMFIIPIPVPIKAKYFVVGYAVIELLSAMLRSNDGVAHMAHLGGMLFGLFMLLHWRNPGGLQKKIRNWWAKHTAPKQRTFHYQKNTKFSDEMGYNQQRKARQEEIDRILAKVKEHGYGSLTDEEKRKLFEASGK